MIESMGSVGLTEVGGQRRLQALAAVGHPDQDVAQWLGVDVGVIHSLQAGEARIGALAAPVAEVFDRHATRQGPCQWTRMVARRAGWVSIMAWDDIDRDREPQGVRPPVARRAWSKDARKADYQAAAVVGVEETTRTLLTHWVAMGLRFAEIAAMLRVPEADVTEQYRELCQHD
jgi:hypothetical protein